MITKKTTIVVGAGASCDLGLPLGAGLMKRVANILSGESGQFAKFFRSAVHFLFEQDTDRASNAVKRATALSSPLRTAASIDNFLDQHKNEEDFVAVSKMAIAYAIAEAEKISKLSGGSSPLEMVGRAGDYFLRDFLNIVVRGHQADNIHESLQNLTFVIFNYDRCVERYLDNWMKMRFGNDFQWVDRGPTFLHVYGSLGDYFDPKSYSPFDYQGDMAFQNPHHALPNFVDKIKVFTESEDSNVRTKIEESVVNAEALMFLGFGFEEQNMRFFGERSGQKKVFATLHSMKRGNADFLADELAKKFSPLGDRVYTLNGTAKELIDDYYHPLTRAVGSI